MDTNRCLKIVVEAALHTNEGRQESSIGKKFLIYTREENTQLYHNYMWRLKQYYG